MHDFLSNQSNFKQENLAQITKNSTFTYIKSKQEDSGRSILQIELCFLEKTNLGLVMTCDTTELEYKYYLESLRTRGKAPFQ